MLTLCHSGCIRRTLMIYPPTLISNYQILAWHRELRYCFLELFTFSYKHTPPTPPPPLRPTPSFPSLIHSRLVHMVGSYNKELDYRLLHVFHNLYFGQTKSGLFLKKLSSNLQELVICFMKLWKYIFSNA